ncbi:hypothetical protein PIOMA14_I_0851 [Prevotella intermedia]|jgi:hypothetical protein|uniref:Uncharacterized protein n=1 Tax=Prevotella intermedia TaxID=28131 RepID=A0A0S3UIN1_PREIN|nr:hypothetical protein PIOMA14_I_0851 [Prevotella intermedia]
MYSNAKQPSLITFSFTLLYNHIAILEEKYCNNVLLTWLYYVLFTVVVAVLFGKSGKNSGLLYFSCVSFL